MNADTEVLRETVTRVETLAEDVQNLTKNIQINASQALANLHPLAQQARGSSDIHTNIRNALSVLEELKVYTTTIEQQAQTIKGGIAAAGMSVYGTVWNDLDSTLQELTSSKHKRFYGLVEQIQSLQSFAESELKGAVKQDAERVFSDREPLQSADPADVKSLAETYAFAVQRNQQKPANVQVVNQIRRMTTEALGTQKVESAAALKKFKAFARQYVENQKIILHSIFPEVQAQNFLGLIEEMFQSEEAQLSKKVTRLSQGKEKGELNALDEIDSSMQYNVPGENMPHTLEVAAENLVTLYAQVDSVIKSQRLDTEGIPNATNTAARAIRDVAKRRQGAVEALKMKAPRYYLPSPAPAWLKGFPITNKLPDLLDLYFADIIENLFQSLMVGLQKTSRTIPQQGLFLLINTSFMKQYLTANQLDESIGALAHQRLKKSHNQGIKLYLADWQRLSQHLMDPTQTKPGGKLSSKDREAVKERFRQFNTEFEVLVEKQRKVQIPNRELRTELSSSIAGIIGPLYKQFYDRHSGGDFTKNLDKYIKYDLRKMDEILSTL